MKGRHEGGSSGERSWDDVGFCPHQPMQGGLPSGLIFALYPHNHLLITSDFICHRFILSAGLLLQVANRPLRLLCQQPMPGVLGSWHSHSTQTQSTKSHCGLIGSSSCGNQLHWEFLHHPLIFACEWQREKGQQNEFKWHFLSKSEWWNCSSCDLNVTLTSNSSLK